MTKTEMDETLQLLRTLKTSQVRKQLEQDNVSPLRYFSDKAEEWVPRSQLIREFLLNAKEQT